MRGSVQAVSLTPLASFTAPHPACPWFLSGHPLPRRTEGRQAAKWNRERTRICLRTSQVPPVVARRRGTFLVEALSPGGNGHAGNGAVAASFAGEFDVTYGFGHL